MLLGRISCRRHADQWQSSKSMLLDCQEVAARKVQVVKTSYGYQLGQPEYISKIKPITIDTKRRDTAMASQNEISECLACSAWSSPVAKHTDVTATCEMNPPDHSDMSQSVASPSVAPEATTVGSVYQENPADSDLIVFSPHPETVSTSSSDTELSKELC